MRVGGPFPGRTDRASDVRQVVSLSQRLQQRPGLESCLPFLGRKKTGRRLTYSERSLTEDYSSRRSSIDRLGSSEYSPTSTLTSRAEKLTFSSETESYNVPDSFDAARDVTPAPRSALKRSNTITGSTAKEKEKDMKEEMDQLAQAPVLMDLGGMG